MHVWGNKKSCQFIGIVLVSVCLLVILPLVVSADDDVEMVINPGMQGDYKAEMPLPIEVVITNHGEDLEGDVVVEGAIAYYQPISVASGTTQHVDVLAANVGSSTNVQLIVDGRVIAEEQVGGRSLGNDTFWVGVLAADADTANFLGDVRGEGILHTTHVSAITDADIPTFSQPLTGLDMLIVNNYALDQLTANQMDAIKQWVLGGGVLLLSGAGQSVLDPFDTIAPVQIDGTTELQSFVQLSEISEVPLELDDTFTIQRITDMNGKIILEEDGQPLIVVGQAEAGRVVYAAYDLAEEPLASWAGNARLWAQLLPEIDPNVQAVVSAHPRHGNAHWALRQAAEQFPTIQMPNITSLLIVYGLYVLVVGPILYVILRRLNKREWMWWTVPVIASLTGLAIFLSGSMDRTSDVHVHNVGYIDMHEPGTAHIEAATAIFSPRAGDYVLRTSGSHMYTSIGQTYHPPGANVQPEAYVSIDRDDTRLEMNGMDHWSIEQIGVQAKQAEVGQFDSELRYTDGKVEGTITNNTVYSLRDVHVLFEGQQETIDELNSGQSVAVSFDFSAQHSGHRMNPYHTSQLMPSTPYRDRGQMREASLLNGWDSHIASQSQTVSSRQNGIQLIGWTEDAILEYEVEGYAQQDSHLGLLTAHLDVQPNEDGYAYFPAGTFPLIIAETSNAVHYVGHAYEMPQGGEVIFETQFVYNDEPINIHDVYVRTGIDQSQGESAFFNWQTESYESSIDVLENQRIASERLDEFVSDAGELRLRITNTYEGYFHFQEPLIGVEGEVAND